jgi:hypothetical protein
LSTESNGDTGWTAIVVDGFGNIHVVWRDDSDILGADTDDDIFHKVRNYETKSWSATVLVSTESTSYSGMPSIAIDSKNNLHIVWYDYTDYNGAGTDSDIFYKKWDISSSSWSNAQIVSDTPYTDTSVHPSITVDTSDNVHIVWKDYFAQYVIAYRYWDSIESSWSDIEVIDTESTASVSGPSIAADPSNNLHVVWPDETNITASGIDSDIVYKYWDSSTLSWSTTEVISSDSTEDCWSSDITTDNLGNVHVVWKDYTPYPQAKSPYWSIAYKRWNSTSMSWGSTQIVNKESVRYSAGPRIVADSLNNLHVVWTEYGITAYEDVLYNHWDTSTLKWGSTEELSAETYSSAGADIAVGSHSNLHLAYSVYYDYEGSGDDTDIYYKNRIKDSDRDGMPDLWEENNGLNSTIDDSGEDPDNDGLTNLEEYHYNTNPQSADSDGDGFSDKEEIDEGTDPLDPDDHPTEDTITVSFLPIVSIIALVRMGIKRRKGKR